MGKMKYSDSIKVLNLYKDKVNININKYKKLKKILEIYMSFNEIHHDDQDILAIRNEINRIVKQNNDLLDKQRTILAERENEVEEKEFAAKKEMLNSFETLLISTLNKIESGIGII